MKRHLNKLLFISFFLHMGLFACLSQKMEPVGPTNTKPTKTPTPDVLLDLCFVDFNKAPLKRNMYIRVSGPEEAASTAYRSLKSHLSSVGYREIRNSAEADVIVDYVIEIYGNRNEPFKQRAFFWGNFNIELRNIKTEELYWSARCTDTRLNVPMTRNRFTEIVTAHLLKDVCERH